MSAEGRATPGRLPETGGNAGHPSLERFFEVEEAVLRRGVRGAHVATVLDGPVVSVGVAVPTGSRFPTESRSAGVPVVRRQTGGTALLHGSGDLLWSIVLPRSDPKVGRDFARAYDRLGAPVVTFLRSEGLDAEWVASPGVSDEYCTLGLRGKVLSAQGRILGGAAQHATSAAVLHHGAISWTVDRPALGRLFCDRGEELAGRLAGLAELGLRGPPDRFVEPLARELAAFVGDDGWG